jgi:hypothetical protein
MSRLLLLLIVAASVAAVLRKATAERGGSYDPRSDR